MSYARYAQAQVQTERPQQTEVRALAIVNGKLQAAADSGDRVALIEAIHLNRRLWNIFHCDLMHPDNGLPEHVRGQLISLAIWVQKHSSKVMRGEKPAESLINVNRDIMEGLKAQGQGTSQQGADATRPTQPSAANSDVDVPQKVSLGL